MGDIDHGREVKRGAGDDRRQLSHLTQPHAHRRSSIGGNKEESARIEINNSVGDHFRFTEEQKRENQYYQYIPREEKYRNRIPKNDVNDATIPAKIFLSLLDNCSSRFMRMQ
jgi:hypothetical protein